MKISSFLMHIIIITIQKYFHQKLSPFQSTNINFFQGIQLQFYPEIQKKLQLLLYDIIDFPMKMTNFGSAESNYRYKF